MLGIIRVLTTEDLTVLNEHGKQMEAFLGIKNETECISDQWNGIYDEKSEEQALPKIVSLAENMINKNRYTALTISCAADPALEALQKDKKVPIIGAGSSGANIAKSLGNKVGVLGITSEAPTSIQNILGNDLIYKNNKDIRKTTDLFQDDAKNKLYETTYQLINENVDVILFACTGFSTIKLKDFLKKYTKKPIVDLIEAQSLIYKAIV